MVALEQLPPKGAKREQAILELGEVEIACHGRSRRQSRN